MKIAVGSSFECDGDVWTVVSLSPDTVHATNTAGGTASWNMGHVLSLPAFTKSAKTSTLAALDIEKTQKTASAAERERLLYTTLILEGPSDAFTAAAPDEWGPQSALTQDKQIANAAKLTGCTERTIFNWLKKVREDGKVACLDGRRKGAKNPFGTCSPELEHIVRKVVGSQACKSRVTNSALVREIRAIASKEKVACPSNRTLHNYVGVANKLYSTHLSKGTQRSLDSSPTDVFRRYEPTHPFQLVEMDTSPLDALAIDGKDGKPATPFLTLAIDLYSRSIVAWRLTPSDPTAEDITFMLFDMLAPKVMREDWPETASWKYGIPETLIFPDHESPISSVPCGVPSEVAVDNGRVYRSTQFKNACKRLRININYARPYKGTDKGHIERLFGTISRSFTESLDGFKGADVGSRGDRAHVEAKTRYTCEELEHEFADWVTNVYQNEPHTGLPDPSDATKYLTPNQMYEVGISIAGFVHVPPSQNDLIQLLQPIYRLVGREGIKVDGLRYDCTELHPYRKASSTLTGTNGKWLIRYDRRDMSHIWFLAPTKGDEATGTWTRVPCILPSKERPFAKNEVNYIKSLATATNHGKGKIAEQLMNEYLTRREAREFASQKEAKVAHIGQARSKQAAYDRKRATHGTIQLGTNPTEPVSNEQNITPLLVGDENELGAA